MAFGTPIGSYEWPDSGAINAALRAEVMRRASDQPGLRRSNAGGWHSANDLLLWDADGIPELRDRITRFAADMTGMIVSSRSLGAKREFAAEAWANLSRAGDYHNLHDHPGAHWSGVYYVSSGGMDSDDPQSGRLELMDPRLGVNMLPLEGSLYTGRMLIDPTPGLMVVFPSWLKHFVHPFRGAGERISISFNITVKPATPMSQDA